MYDIKLANLLPNGQVRFIYELHNAMEEVGPEEYAELVPVVILRYAELERLNSLNLEDIRTALEEAVTAPGQL